MGAPFPGLVSGFKTIIPDSEEHLLAASGRQPDALYRWIRAYGRRWTVRFSAALNQPAEPPTWSTLPPPFTLSGKERRIEESELQPFYLYGRLTAVLEQGARGTGEVPWLDHYYPREASSPRQACESPLRDTGTQSSTSLRGENVQNVILRA